MLHRYSIKPIYQAVDSALGLVDLVQEPRLLEIPPRPPFVKGAQESSLRLALRFNDDPLRICNAIELIHQAVDLAVGFFDLALELLLLSANGLLKTLVEGEHHVHEGH